MWFCFLDTQSDAKLSCIYEHVMGYFRMKVSKLQNTPRPVVVFSILKNVPTILFVEESADERDYVDGSHKLNSYSC